MCPKIDCAIPAAMAAETDPYQIVHKIMIDNGFGEAFEMLKAASDAVFNPARWKDACAAMYPVDKNGADAVASVKAAIIFYHGAAPQEGAYNIVLLMVTLAIRVWPGVPAWHNKGKNEQTPRIDIWQKKRRLTEPPKSSSERHDPKLPQVSNM